MEELEVTLGQRTLPSVYGEHTIASAYAGLGLRHVLVLADGSTGAVGSRLAAQTAASAALMRIRASVLPELSMTLDEAFLEAHQAVRRVMMGTEGEGRAGVALLIAVVSPEGLHVARVGSGRAYVFTGTQIDAVFNSAGAELLGFEGPEPLVEQVSTPLSYGSRVLIMSESGHRTLAGDLDRLARGGPPQLTAAKLADAARRRGQLDSVSTHVLDLQGEGPRDGHHPALSRIAREKPPTFDPEGRQLGKTGLLSPRRSGQPGKGSPLVMLALLLGVIAIAGVVAMKWSDDLTVPTPPPMQPIQALELPPEPLDPPPEAPPLPELTESAPPEVALSPVLVAVFDTKNPGRLAKNIRSYITKNYPERKKAVFKELEDAILASPREPHLIEALLQLMGENELKHTVRWVQNLLPRLYAKDSATPSPSE